MMSNFAILREVFKYIEIDKPKLLYVNLLGMVQVVLQLAIPYGSLVLINEAIPDKNVHQLITVSLVLALSVIASNLLALVALKKTMDIRESLKLQLQQNLLYKIECLPMTRHNDESVGTFAHLILGESESVVEFICNLTEVGKTLLWIFVAVYVIPQVNLAVGLFVLASLPIYAILLKVFNSRIATQFNDVQTHTFEQSSLVYGTLTGMKEVKSYQMENTQADKFGNVTSKRKKHLVKGQMLMAIGGNLSEAVITAATLFILLYGGYGVMNGVISLGEVVALNTIVFYLYAPFTTLVDAYLDFNSVKCSVERVTDVMQESDDLYGDDRLKHQSFGHIAIENMCFSREDRLILNDVNMIIKPGEKCLLVGQNGQGKSTLLNLVFRLLKPDSGKIMIDGNDISTLELAQVRENIAVVHQDCHLFSDTIYQNILVGNPQATQQQVLQICDDTGLSEVIAQLPDGWDTVVGENGCKLSGGQKQLVAITRAFLKDAPILLLDEATSALDHTKEKHMIEVLNTLVKDKTTIIVSHKYESVINQVDRYFELDGGYINERPIDEGTLDTEHKTVELESLAIAG